MGELHAKTLWLDFLVFHGEDRVGWIYKVHQLFNFYNTLSQHQLSLASFHKEGKALIWFQDL